jgi:hypothetical protein
VLDITGPAWLRSPFAVLQMSTRKKRLVLLLVAPTALLVGALIVGLTTVRGRLLDGSAVALQKVSYGTNCSGPEAPLEGLLRRLPAKWHGRIQWSPSSKSTSTSDLPIFTFWLSLSSSNAASQSISYAIADEDGFESPMIFTGFYGSYNPGGFFSKKRVGLVRGTGIFPRGSKRFFLRLYQRNGNGDRVRVAEYPVTNAGFQNSRTWKSEILPIERQTNGLTFALIKAEVGVSAPGPLQPPYDAQCGEWGKLRFRVGALGHPSADWNINEILVSDEAGNQARVSGEDLGAFNHQLSHVEGDEIVCLHRWEFWSREPAWKLKVHFEQATNSNDYWVEYLVRPEFLNLRNASAKNSER